jgi:hypothetical protein
VMLGKVSTTMEGSPPDGLKEKLLRKMPQVQTYGEASYFYSLMTGRRLHRTHWTTLPMPEESKDHVDQFARRANAHQGFIITDSNGNTFDDDFDNIDKENSNYEPNDGTSHDNESYNDDSSHDDSDGVSHDDPEDSDDNSDDNNSVHPPSLVNQPRRQRNTPLARVNDDESDDESLNEDGEDIDNGDDEENGNNKEVERTIEEAGNAGVGDEDDNEDEDDDKEPN